MTQFFQFPLFIQIALVVIILCLIGLMFTSIGMASTRWLGYKNAQLTEKYEPIFLKLFTQLVFDFHPERTAENAQTIALAEKEYLQSKKVRRLLVGYILHYKTLFSGSVGRRLVSLYKDFDLQRDALSGLKSNRKETLVLALKELLDMQVPVDPLLFTVLKKHKQIQVREMARRCILTLSEQNPFQVFDELNEPLSQWEQLELFKVISEMNYNKIPKFAHWIHDKSDPSLISLCLKLTVYFQQYDSVPILIKMLKTTDVTLRAEVINALGKLHQPECEAAMVKLYDNEVEAVKIEIIKALGRTGSGDYLNLLKSIFDHEPSVLLRKHAAKSIIKHDALGKRVYDVLYKQGQAADRIILDHVANTNIKY